uniref:Uncharacterized protein n=1 Tax=Anguilla anguilla TaxID=7936 RepID=A0A0E9W3B9_ANGAN
MDLDREPRFAERLRMAWMPETKRMQVEGNSTPAELVCLQVFVTTVTLG